MLTFYVGSMFLEVLIREVLHPMISLAIFQKGHPWSPKVSWAGMHNILPVVPLKVQVQLDLESRSRNMGG